MANEITLQNQAHTITVTIPTIKAETINPDRPRDFTKGKVASGEIVYDVGTTKKSWSLLNDVPLTSQQISDLETLYGLGVHIELTENWVESSVVYDVFFEHMKRRFGTPQGALRYEFIFQEL